MAAFTAVDARRGFGSARESPAQSTKPFPDAVREYVARCFDSKNTLPGVSIEQMQERLKVLIKEIVSHDAMDATDWASLPTPQEMIRDERAALGAGSESLMRGQKRPFEKEPEDFENRLTFPTRAKEKKRKAKDVSAAEALSKSANELERERRERALRFGATGTVPPELDEMSRGPVIGTSRVLEKRYLRLTSAPNPANVRPQPVLEQTLELLKQKWKTEDNYSYTCDQFKSMRQDLTVQHIKNAFTVNVYETHARIALQKGDMGEYNQCQTQLRALYKLRVGGRPAEFLAYRILYLIYTGNRTGMSDLLAGLGVEDRQSPVVKHALHVRSALALGNYSRFFQLYLDAPNMGPYLMDMFVGRERISALARLAKSYKPDVTLNHVVETLAFEDERECANFVCENGGQELLERRDGRLVLMTGKAGQVFETKRAEAFRRVDLKGQI